MKKHQRFTAVIHREDKGYVALCPELDVVSQGSSIEEAHRNLQEAVELTLETADIEEIAARLNGQVYITALDVEFEGVAIG